GTINPAEDSALLDNVRLWDLRAYNATIAKIQALRPYYTFPNTNSDRYFINPARAEFDYPPGEHNKYSAFQGTGGFPVGSFLLKTAAAISEGEPNIIFTGYLTGESRMMIHRNVLDRLQYLAGFLTWDQDPYLVITDDGRLVWMAGGYTTY